MLAAESAQHAQNKKYQEAKVKNETAQIQMAQMQQEEESLGMVAAKAVKGTRSVAQKRSR